MYLFKHPSSVYYTRVNFPSSLQQKGYLTEKRISFLTKEHKRTIIRNLEVARIAAPLYFPLFKMIFNAHVILLVKVNAPTCKQFPRCTISVVDFCSTTVFKFKP